MTEKPQHTPGPWSIGNADGYNAAFIHAKDETVCHVYGIYLNRTLQDLLKDSDRIECCAIGLSNARLIASAPELLEALSAIKSHWDSGNFSLDPELWQAMNKAIAKAKGTN